MEIGASQFPAHSSQISLNSFMQNISMAQIKVKRVSINQMIDADDELAVEEPLEIQLSYGGLEKTVSVTMRTPGQDKELAAGFLFTEGIIQHNRQVMEIYELPFS